MFIRCCFTNFRFRPLRCPDALIHSRRKRLSCMNSRSPQFERFPCSKHCGKFHMCINLFHPHIFLNNSQPYVGVRRAHSSTLAGLIFRLIRLDNSGLPRLTQSSSEFNFSVLFMVPFALPASSTPIRNSFFRNIYNNTSKNRLKISSDLLVSQIIYCHALQAFLGSL